jgi:flagellar hook-length control protein FliK
MNHELLFTENTFQKTLVSSRNDAVSKNNRSAFGTDRASQSDQQKFAEYLNANKKKNETDKSPQSSAHSKNDSKTDDARESHFMDRFATQRAKTHGENSQAASDNDMALLDITNIAALQEEIQRIIAAQSEAEEAQSIDGDSLSVTSEGTITVDANDAKTDGDTQKIDSLFALIASFLNEEDEDTVNRLGQGDSHQDLSELLGKIQKALDNGDIPSLTSGLTVEQLTALDENLEAYIEGKLSDKEEEILETLAAQWVTMMPPASKTDAKAKPDDTAVKTDIGAASAQGDTLASKTAMTEERHYAQSRYDTRYSAQTQTGNADAGADAEQGASDFKAAIKAEGAQQAAPQQATSENNSAAQRFLQSSAPLPPGLDGFAEQTQAMGMAQANAQSAAQNPLTSVVTQSQNATQAHPATQLVSATIQKAVKAGDDTNIKLRLDPPELGRVEVKMSIDKDNVAKIVLTAEKPETFMMLQKDSHVLQQALNDSGVDTQGDISFELASDNQDFGRDGEQHNNRSGSGRGKDSADNETILETTMDWHVDPATGQTRYNILA